MAHDVTLCYFDFAAGGERNFVFPAFGVDSVQSVRFSKAVVQSTCINLPAQEKSLKYFYPLYSIMGLTLTKTFPLRPYTPLPAPFVLNGNDWETFHVIRLVLGGWALSSYVKGYHLRDTASSPSMLYELQLQPDARRLLKTLHFVVWYLAMRLVTSSAGPRSWLKKLTLKLRQYNPRLIAFIALFAIQFLDEAIFLLIQLTANAKHSLVGKPMCPLGRDSLNASHHPKLQDIGEMVSCNEPIINFGSSVLLQQEQQYEHLTANPLTSQTPTAVSSSWLSCPSSLIIPDSKQQVSVSDEHFQDDTTLCSICRDMTPAKRLFCFCPASETHVCHWDCMQAWYESEQPMAHCCPVCRTPLNLAPAPLQDRILIMALSRKHWRSVIARSTTVISCVGVSVLIYSTLIGLDALRKVSRPGYGRRLAFS